MSSSETEGQMKDVRSQSRRSQAPIAPARAARGVGLELSVMEQCVALGMVATTGIGRGGLVWEHELQYVAKQPPKRRTSGRRRRS